MRRLILLRHGETTGDAKVRFHGSGDHDLSPSGREQMREAAASLRGEPIDVVVASPARRAWQSARLVAEGRPVRLLDAFREIHFGRWEGLSREEIQEQDPILYEDWQKEAPGFEYPGGEPRAAFRARVEQGLRELARSPGHSALVVTHKGVIRAIVGLLTGEKPPRDVPALGGSIELVAEPDGSWRVGRRSSNPPGLEAA